MTGPTAKPEPNSKANISHAFHGGHTHPGNHLGTLIYFQRFRHTAPLTFQHKTGIISFKVFDNANRGEVPK